MSRLILLLPLFFSANAFAKNVCIVAGPVHESHFVAECDERVNEVSSISAPSILKHYLDRGYTLVTQSSNGSSTLWTLVK